VCIGLPLVSSLNFVNVKSFFMTLDCKASFLLDFKSHKFTTQFSLKRDASVHILYTFFLILYKENSSLHCCVSI
jgi:hypothetical protein